MRQGRAGAAANGRVVLNLRPHVWRRGCDGIATVHHPLGQVDPGPGDVLAVVHIDHFVNRAAVNSHPQRDPRMLSQGSRNFQGALRRCFRICAENKRHPIARREPDQFSFRLGFAKFVCAANDFIELA